MQIIFLSLLSLSLSCFAHLSRQFIFVYVCRERECACRAKSINVCNARAAKRSYDFRHERVRERTNLSAYAHVQGLRPSLVLTFVKNFTLTISIDTFNETSVTSSPYVYLFLFSLKIFYIYYYSNCVIFCVCEREEKNV